MKKAKLLLYILTLSPLLILVFLFSISIGNSESGLKFDFEILLNILTSKVDEIQKAIIFQIRIPRALTAVFAGGGLAVAGAILQAMIRNPLAEPYILGISSGSAFGAVISIVLIGSFSIATPLSSMLGSILVTILVYVLGKRKGILDINTMLLTGIMIGAFFSALILIIITLSNESIKNFIFWMLGNLSNANLKQSILVAVSVLILTLFSFAHSYRLNLIATGEEIATQLGIDAELTKKIFYFIASILTAIIVSITGIIGFVGLVVPHICRKIFGVDYRILIPTSFFTGAVILMIADTVSRVVLYPAELPVGSITAVFGAPFFIYLLKK